MQCTTTMRRSTLLRRATQRCDHSTCAHQGAVTQRHDGQRVLSSVADLVTHGRPRREGPAPLLTRVHRLRTHPVGVHPLHHLVHAGRRAHEGGETPLQRREASQCQRQSRGLWRTRACCPRQGREGVKAPRSLSTHPAPSPCGSGLRGQHTGTSRVLKPVAQARAQALHVLQAGQRGRGVVQGVGDPMAPIAAPRRPMRGRQEGSDTPVRALGAAVTHPMRGPPTALDTREANRVDPGTVPWLAQAQPTPFDLLQRERCAHASGSDRDPQHPEGLRAPERHRTLGDAPPRRIAGALSLVSARAAETSGPATARRAVRPPGEQASPTQTPCPEHGARGAAREGTVQHEMAVHSAEKKWVWSMVVGSGARVRALVR